jgi:hypothetical protein
MLPKDIIGFIQALADGEVLVTLSVVSVAYLSANHHCFAMKAHRAIDECLERGNDWGLCALWFGGVHLESSAH